MREAGINADNRMRIRHDAGEFAERKRPGNDAESGQINDPAAARLLDFTTPGQDALHPDCRQCTHELCPALFGPQFVRPACHAEQHAIARADRKGVPGRRHEPVVAVRAGIYSQSGSRQCAIALDCMLFARDGVTHVVETAGERLTST